MSDRKPRSDSKLDAMPESRVLELRDMLMAGASHRNVLDWLAVECGVSVSPSALTSFYRRHCSPLVRERRKFSVVKAEAFGDAMLKDPQAWDEKIIEKVKQRAFEFLEPDGNADPKAMTKLLDSIVKARKQEFTEENQREKVQLEKRRLALMEEKAAEAKAKILALTTNAKSKGGLTPETLAEIEAAAGLL